MDLNASTELEPLAYVRVGDGDPRPLEKRWRKGRSEAMKD
jgi:hypothetical protein